MATKNVNLENEAAVEMTEDEKKATVRKYENDILGGLMAAAAYKTDAEEAVPIEIKRNGAVVLSFRIRPMGEDEYLKCKKDNTNYKRNKQLGTRVAESVDAARYRAQLIYEATVEEDRDKIWDNRDAWKNLNVLNGIDLVEVVLKSGEKDEILSNIIFQRHHIPFDEFLSKPDWAQVLMLESMKIQLIAEQKARDGTEEGGE